MDISDYPGLSAPEAAPGDNEEIEAVVLGNAEGVVVAWNACAEIILGWSANEAIGKPLAVLIAAPPYARALDADMKKCAREVNNCTLCQHWNIPALHKDGRTVEVVLTVAALVLKDEECFSASIRCRRRQAANREANTKQTNILDLSRDAMVTMSPDGEIQFWNTGAERMFGYCAREAVGCKWHELLAPDFPAQFNKIQHELAAGGHWEGELVGMRRDGTRLTLLSRWQMERDYAGRPVRMLVCNTDIALWNRYFASLVRDTRQTFDSLFEHHHDGVFAFDLEQGLVCANPALSELMGYSSKELLSLPLDRLVADEQLDALRSAFLEASRGKPQASEFTCIRIDRSKLDASITLLPNIVDNRIAGVHGVVKDISYRKRDERRILYLANHDPLTGLPNRNLLHDRMRTRSNRRAASPPKSASCLWI